MTGPDRSAVKLIAIGLVVIIVVIVAGMVTLAVLGKPGVPELATGLVAALTTYLSGTLFFGHAVVTTATQAQTVNATQTGAAAATPEPAVTSTSGAPPSAVSGFGGSGKTSAEPTAATTPTTPTTEAPSNAPAARQPPA